MSNKENTSEEIDLGQLFKFIGDGFNKLFHFIGNIFKTTFHLIILFLQFIRTHFIKFVIAGTLGLGVGWYWDSISDPIYRSSMIVEPNFNSVQQLYNNIEFYNELAEKKESRVLGLALKVSDSLAKTIVGVKIESFSDNTQRIRQFSEFIQELDTVSRKLVEYEDYLKNFNDINAKFHRIQIDATDPEVAKKCQNAILKSIENNEYFQLQKKVNDENIALKDSLIEKQLGEIDSLHYFYKRIKLLEANKPVSSTSINLAEDTSVSSTTEIDLLLQSKELKEEKIQLNNLKANTENTINVISDFPAKGVLSKEFLKSKKILFPLILISLVFFILMLLSLNTYLKNYNKD
ncbi:hypothetical protein [Aquimarina sp. 2201CG5-10]|uniref:hypothetical protein n=1 Tax=Aquimarina callyspongiae TaxID=3098150 RepID=UPI002AB42643|nr:hypothetical protein [Aquimarina sp. 2201CG5-10]MDY8138667.1 hypothetical protein [Aquimarina sp. 2201CG5-10]